MKIVLLSFLFEPEIGGGAAVVVNQLAHLLEQRSHSVVVITTWKGNYVKTDHVDGIKIIRIPPKNLYWVGDKDNQPVSKKIVWQLVDIWNPLTYQVVRQILVNEKPDIVHSHKLRGLSPSIWSAATSTGVKKIVHTCHDYELLSPEGYFMGRVGRLAQQQSVAMRPYQYLRSRFSRLVNDATAPSRFVMDCHRKMGFFSKAKTRIIPNSHGFDFIELQEINSATIKKDYKLKDLNFLYIGRLDKAKGVDLVCQTFSQANNQNWGFHLTITGWGPLDGFLREKYKDQKNISFTGPVFGKNKEKLFKTCDVLIAPSRSHEPFGIIVVEAYSFGMPVITSNAGAFPEIVRENETGFLVEPGSIDDLVSVLKKISQDSYDLSEMSGNCFLEAQKYSTNEFINSYLDIYGIPS